MTSYFDSGILIKLYVSESNSAEAAEPASGVPQIPLLSLHELEKRNAIRALLGRELITANLAISAFEADIASRRHPSWGAKDSVPETGISGSWRCDPVLMPRAGHTVRVTPSCTIATMSIA